MVWSKVVLCLMLRNMHCRNRTLAMRRWSRQCERYLDAHQTMMVPYGKDCRTVSYFPFSRGASVERAAQAAICGWHVRQLVARARCAARPLCSRSRPRQLQLSGVEAPVLRKNHPGTRPGAFGRASASLSRQLRADRLHVGPPGQLLDGTTWRRRLQPEGRSRPLAYSEARRPLRKCRSCRQDSSVDPRDRRDHERLAYQCLLAHSSNSVGVHDLIVPGEP